MAKVLPMDLCGVLALWVVMLACGLAELQYFPQHTNYNWSEARNHCQVCFKDLVTLTPENIVTIVRNISSDHWIGLRKRPVSLPVHSYNDTSSFWSRWANGDPLTFQNWYPGYPVFKSPTMDCCSCQCTCPLQPLTTPQPTLNTTVRRNYTFPNTTYFSSHTSQSPFNPTTPNLSKPIQSECEKSPMVFQDVPDPNENYIEDGCVVVLNFGAWVEKECSMLLPFICYEERFFGQVQVHPEGPQNETVLESLTLTVQNLTAGTKYFVQVFPVKCGRELNPQNKTFYTVPNNVSNLTVVNETVDCVSLSWIPPSGVADESQWSEISKISAFTNPEKVSNLQTENVTDSSLSLSWKQVNDTNYVVSWCYKNGTSDDQLCETDVNETKEISDLPSGTNISVSVTALANKRRGEPATIFTLTAPKKVQELNLYSTEYTITAKWIYPNGFPNFRAELLPGGVVRENINTYNVTFDKLNSSTRYTVKVYSVAEKSSEEVSASKYTLPVPPRELKCTHSNKTHLRFVWLPPKDTEKADYKVTLKSDFWRTDESMVVKKETEYTFGKLKSGTTYTFEVRTMAGDLLSNPMKTKHATVPVLKQISLSMVCSSAQSLHCAAQASKESAFSKMKNEFNNLLEDHIFWSLKRINTSITGV
uniref:Uncharacterized protein n=1 Tax=Knipowitschia caucasica TaxID=637954 RepID=A0AAV2KQ72_KNICA